MNIDFKQTEWDSSYSRFENYIFQPKEETIKFINRFIKKQISLDEYNKNPNFKNINNNALDFGCGIGSQTYMLFKLGFNSFGCDISKKAISDSKLIYSDYKIDFQQINSTDLPYTDNFFDLIIADSVLDSMNQSLSLEYMSELNRICNEFLYITLISSKCESNCQPIDKVVNTEHEKNTVQNYFNFEKINRLTQNTDFKIIWMNELIELREDHIFNSRYHIVLKK